MLTAWWTPPFSDTPILADTLPESRAMLRAQGCRGEVMSFSFCVRSTDEMDVEIGPRVSCFGIDVRHVVRWIQNRAIDYGVVDPGIVPELLLRDPSLVRMVDGKNVMASPLVDSETTRPLAAKANTTYQYWVTVRIPADALPRQWEISIRVSNRGAGKFLWLRQFLRVLPFDLAPSPMVRSIYYTGEYGKADKTPEVYAADMRSMADHGITSPLLWEDFNVPFLPTNPGPTTRLENAIAARRAAGLSVDPLFAAGTALAYFGVEEVTRRLRLIREFLDGHGIVDFGFLGFDEPTTPQLENEALIFECAKQMGFLTLSTLIGQTAVDAQGILWHRLSIALLNTSSHETLPAWHKLGAKAWRYGPTSPEAPEAWYRRYYGLEAYRLGFDGMCPFAAQARMGPSIWDDMDSPFKDACLFYPGANSPIETIQYEATRQANNDVRYAETLRQLGGVVPSEDGWDLDTVRSEIIRRILDRMYLTVNRIGNLESEEV